ncbi:MAG: anaerobic ribonucleoside-triphosphate reductase activating protein [Alphaproteobacteria bacterium]|nr:anaerobic ribonucleoside-triphosphate reductase activating protein [Alphaproteobacteria bacterium]
MPILAGYIPFTSVDWPDHIASAVFFQGCPLRCPYCQNKPLQGMEPLSGASSFEAFLAFLEKRKKVLSAVVLSGGEPLVQKDLREAAEQIKEMGFELALHTAGVNFERFKEVMPLVSWVGLDIKAPFNKYEKITCRKNVEQETLKCLTYLVERKLPFEARTTFDESLLTKEDILTLAEDLKEKGVESYALQECRSFDETGVSVELKASWTQDEAFLLALKNIFPKIILRTEIGNL